MRHTLLITGAAGYVGTMLVREFAKRTDVERIIGLDKEPVPELIAKEPKLLYIQMNTADAWEEKVRAEKPDIVIHAAWQIREMYGNRALEWKWNIEGSDKVFDFAFAEPSVKKLIHFSTVASYGAFPGNSVNHRFTEEQPFRQSEYLYAEEKRIAEEHLKERYEASGKSGKQVHVAVVRPAAITGPRGRYMRIRFGLQAALSGMLEQSFAERFISRLVSFVPVTPKWLRQFVHEDDVVGIIERLTFGPPVDGYQAFNLAPPGPSVLGADMAKAVGKSMLRIYPWMVRLAFFWTWHLSRGKIPTSPGAWRGYSYPIAVDGSKVTTILGYHYQHEGYDAFYYTNGAYEEFVPKGLRRHKA